MIRLCKRLVDDFAGSLIGAYISIPFTEYLVKASMENPSIEALYDY
jgi:hypothetical protein